MAGPKTVELLGANNESLRLIGAEAGDVSYARRCGPT